MAKILFTDNSTSNSIAIEDELILKAFTANSLTNIEYLSEEDGYRRTVQVTESLSNVGGQSKLLTSFTEKNSGATIWLNKDRILDVAELNSEAILKFDAAGASPERIKLTDTATAVKTALYTKEGDNLYALDSITASPNKIILATAEGNVTANFTAGVVFTVYGEGDSNDTIYSVVSSAYTTETEITVNETPTAQASPSANSRVWLKA